jgi:hypothetical protein
VTADRRVPAPGEVWVFRHLAPRGRGHVVIDRVIGLEVVFRYLASGSEKQATLAAFGVHYVFAAATVDELPESEFPYRPVPSRGALADAPIRPGTGVRS